MATRDDEKLSSAVDRADISGKEGNEDELLSVVVANGLIKNKYHSMI